MKANKINLKSLIERYLTIEMEHAQYYLGGPGYSGCGTSSGYALANLLEQLPNSDVILPKALETALDAVLTEVEDYRDFIGFSVYARYRQGAWDVEVTAEECDGHHRARELELDDDGDGEFTLQGVLYCSPDTDEMPEGTPDVEALITELRDQIENDEHYFYASLDVESLIEEFDELTDGEASLERWARENDVRLETASLYDTEPQFGVCDITKIKGDVAQCRVLTNKGETLTFKAGDWLIGGALGKAAGAF